MISLEPTLVLCLAFLMDLFAGDPPNRFHPVAWMGSGIAWFRSQFNSGGKTRRFISGLLLVVVGCVVTGATAWLIVRVCDARWPFVAVVLQAMVLKCTFSARSLAGAAKSVADALRSDDIPLARQQVSYHLVSRDVSTLDASGLSAATVESVAENSSDSVIAPLLYFVIAGLPGALVYRFVNTCDAMLGYRTPELEWFGKSAARLDDLLNLIPSRVTALIMLATGALPGTAREFRRAATIWWRDHSLTASPNAGHPMSAAAGVLGVTLEKQGHYRLAAELPPPSSQTISQAIQLLWRTTAIGGCVFFAATLIRGSL